MDSLTTANTAFPRSLNKNGAPEGPSGANCWIAHRSVTVGRARHISA